MSLLSFYIHVLESIIHLNIDESDELFLLAIRRNDAAVTEKMLNQGVLSI